MVVIQKTIQRTSLCFLVQEHRKKTDSDSDNRQIIVAWTHLGIMPRVKNMLFTEND